MTWSSGSSRQGPLYRNSHRAYPHRRPAFRCATPLSRAWRGSASSSKLRSSAARVSRSTTPLNSGDRFFYGHLELAGGPGLAHSLPPTMTSTWCVPHLKSATWSASTDVNSGLVTLGNELTSECVTVPRDGPDVCPVCRGQRDDSARLCESCELCETQLSYVHPVVPISLYAKPSPMRDRLRHYKDSDDAAERGRLGREVAALIERFFVEHSDHLEGRVGLWDAVCVVPSTEREPPHPLERALVDHTARACGGFETLLCRGPGEIAHRKPNRRAFEPVGRVAGRRVLLLDDVLTTGARCQSAASALTAAGADVVLIVVVARRINPDWRPEAAPWWTRQLDIPFSWSTRP